MHPGTADVFVSTDAGPIQTHKPTSWPMGSVQAEQHWFTTTPHGTRKPAAVATSSSTSSSIQPTQAERFARLKIPRAFSFFSSFFSLFSFFTRSIRESVASISNFYLILKNRFWQNNSAFIMYFEVWALNLNLSWTFKP